MQNTAYSNPDLQLTSSLAVRQTTGRDNSRRGVMSKGLRMANPLQPQQCSFKQKFLLEPIVNIKDLPSTHNLLYKKPAINTYNLLAEPIESRGFGVNSPIALCLNQLQTHIEMKARESHGRAAPWGPPGLFNEAGLLLVGLAGTSIRTGKLKRKTIIRDNCLCPNMNIKAPCLPPFLSFYLSLFFLFDPNTPRPPSISQSLSFAVYWVQREKHTPVLTAGQANIICDSWTATSLNKK